MARGPSFVLLSVALLLCVGVPATHAAPFDTLNELLKGHELRVPPMTLFPPKGFDFKAMRLALLDNGTLSGTSIGDIDVQGGRLSASSFAIRVTLKDLDLGVLKSDKWLIHVLGDTTGKAELTTSIGELAFNLSFTSDRPYGPPTQVVAPWSLGSSVCEAKGISLKLHCYPGSLAFGAACDTLILALDAIKLASPVLCPALGLLIPKLDPVLLKIANFTNHFDTKPVPPPVEEGERYTNGLEGMTNFNQSLVTDALKVVDDVFNVPGTPPRSKALVINQLIENILPPGKHPVNLPLPAIAPKKGLLEGVVLNATMHSVTTLGLDITDFNVLSVLANHTLGSKVVVGSLKLGVDLEVELQLPDRLMVGGPKVVFNTSVNATLSNFDFDLNLVLGVNTTQLLESRVGSMLNLSTVFTCLLAPVKGINITYLALGLDNVDLQIENSLVLPPLPSSGGVNTLLNDGAAALVMLFGPAGFGVLPAVTDTLIRPTINTLLTILVMGGLKCKYLGPQTAPAAPPLPAIGGLLQVEGGNSATLEDVLAAGTKASRDIDFVSSGLIKILDFLTTGVLGDFNTDYNANDFVRAAAKTAGVYNGSAIVTTKSHTMAKRLRQVGTPNAMEMGWMNLTVSNIIITGLDSFSNVTLLNPLARDELSNTISMATTTEDENGVTRGSLQVAMDVELLWEECGPLIHDKMHMTLELADVNLDLDATLEVNEARFDETQLDKITEVSCLYSAAEPKGIRVPIAQGSIGTVVLGVECVECTGPAVQAWSDKLKTPEASEGLTKLFNKILSVYLPVLSEKKAQEKFDTNQKEAVCGTPLPESKQTHHSASHGGALMRTLLYVLGLSLPILSILAFTAYRIRRALDEDQRPFLKEAGLANEEAVDDDDVSIYDGFSVWETLRCGETVYGHPAVPNLVRYGVPIAILITAGLMLSSQLYPVSVSINALLHVGGQTKTFDSYDYTSIKFTRDAFDSGEVPMQILAVLIGFLCICWAWFKLFFLMYLFFTPPVVVPHGVRTTLLSTLDFLAKWSLVDSYLNLFLVMFVHTKAGPSGSLAYWVDDMAELELTVSQGYGYYMYATTQFMTLAIGQVILWYNRNVVASVRREIREASTRPASLASESSARSFVTTTWLQEGAEDTTREALRVHLYTKTGITKWVSEKLTRDHSGDPRRPVTPLGRGIVFVSLTACIALVMVGTLIDLMGVKNNGLLVVPIEWDSTVERIFKFWQIPGLFIDAAINSQTKFMNTVLVVFLVFFCFVSPILLFVVWLGMWFVPLRLSEQKKLFFFAECLASWASLDVFCVGIISITLNINNLIEFVMGNKLDGADTFVSHMEAWGFTVHDHVVGGKGVWCSGLYFLIAAAVLSNLVYFVLWQANRCAIKDRERLAWKTWQQKKANRRTLTERDTEEGSNLDDVGSYYADDLSDDDKAREAEGLQ